MGRTQWPIITLSATKWGEGRGEVVLGEQGHEVAALCAIIF